MSWSFGFHKISNNLAENAASRHSSWRTLPCNQNPLPLAGEGRVRAWEHGRSGSEQDLGPGLRRVSRKHTTTSRVGHHIPGATTQPRVTDYLAPHSPLFIRLGVFCCVIGSILHD